MKPTKMQIAEWVRTAANLDACLNLAFAAGMEAAAQVCGKLETQWHREYKGIVSSEHRASQHREGMSDGATDCAAAIRKAKEES